MGVIVLNSYRCSTVLVVHAGLTMEEARVGGCLPRTRPERSRPANRYPLVSFTVTALPVRAKIPGW